MPRILPCQPDGTGGRRHPDRSDSAPGGSVAKRVVYRRFQFVRPHVLHRTPADAAAVWRARLPKYRGMAVVWALATALWAATDGPTAAVTVLAAAACLLTVAVCVMAIGITRRGEAAASTDEAG